MSISLKAAKAAVAKATKTKASEWSVIDGPPIAEHYFSHPRKGDACVCLVGNKAEVRTSP